MSRRTAGRHNLANGWVLPLLPKHGTGVPEPNTDGSPTQPHSADTYSNITKPNPATPTPTPGHQHRPQATPTTTTATPTQPHPSHTDQLQPHDSNLQATPTPNPRDAESKSDTSTTTPTQHHTDTSPDFNSQLDAGSDRDNRHGGSSSRATFQNACSCAPLDFVTGLWPVADRCSSSTVRQGGFTTIVNKLRDTQSPKFWPPACAFHNLGRHHWCLARSLYRDRARQW